MKNEKVARPTFEKNEKVVVRHPDFEKWKVVKPNFENEKVVVRPNFGNEKVVTPLI